MATAIMLTRIRIPRRHVRLIARELFTELLAISLAYKFFMVMRIVASSGAFCPQWIGAATVVGRLRPDARKRSELPER
jgi:hypothetical protein